MFHKIALTTVAAGLTMTAAPSLAQQAPAPATPQAVPQTQPAALTLQAGSDVKGSDGAVLGKLVGVRAVSNGHELTVRGADGRVKGVPTAGIRQDGASVIVRWTSTEFQSAAEIPAEQPAATPPASDSAPTGETPPETPAPTDPQT